MESVTKQGFRTRLSKIDAEKDTDKRFAGSVWDMRAAGVEYVDKYTALMNDVYSYADALPKVDSASLAASQNAWESEKESEANRAMQAAGRSSMAGPAASDVRMRMTHARIIELLDLFA